MKVLLIDDDIKLGGLLEDYLRPYNIALDHLTHPERLSMKSLEAYDVLLLDIMLPQIDGFRVCQQVRAESDIPILMLTARGDTADRVMGLELGADDYLPKPFEPRELVARIQSLHRRRGAYFNTQQRLRIDSHQKRAFLDGHDLELTTMEFQLLELLKENPGRTVSRDQIMDRIQGLESDVFSRSVDILVSRLRSKLQDDPKNPEFVRTARGTGYIFVGNTQPAPQPKSSEEKSRKQKEPQDKKQARE